MNNQHIPISLIKFYAYTSNSNTSEPKEPTHAFYSIKSDTRTSTNLKEYKPTISFNNFCNFELINSYSNTSEPKDRSYLAHLKINSSSIGQE
jgi:hypothetical protein